MACYSHPIWVVGTAKVQAVARPRRACRAYADSDLDLALKLLLACTAEDAHVFKTPSPWARVTVLGDSAVNVTLRCWTTPDDWQNAKCDLIKVVTERFEAKGLTFPYPHQVTVERCSRPFAS